MRKIHFASPVQSFICSQLVLLFFVFVCVCVCEGSGILYPCMAPLCVHFTFTLLLPLSDTKVETKSKWGEWKCRYSRKDWDRELSLHNLLQRRKHVTDLAESICNEVLFWCLFLAMKNVHRSFLVVLLPLQNRVRLVYWLWGDVANVQIALAAIWNDASNWT